jgi:hypothetical protein
MTPPTGQKTLRDEPWFQNLTVGCRHLVQQLANRAARPHLLAAIDEAERRLLAVDPAPQAQGDFRETATAALENLFESISERTDMLGSTTLVVPREAYRAARKALEQLSAPVKDKP